MSGKIAKSQIPIVHQSQLPDDVRTAVISFKNALRCGTPMQPFGNENPPGMGSPLPNLADGCVYYEYRVGHAHPGDPRPAGSRRLVAEVSVKARQIQELYFTDSHYVKGTFHRIV